MFTVSPEQIRYADSLAVSKYGISELTLMKNAAKSCYGSIISHVKHKEKIVILCGKGNNGGDGYEIARLMHTMMYNVCVINVFDCEPTTDTAKSVFDDCKKCGVQICSSDLAEAILQDADIIIDALFGVGFYGCIEKGSSLGLLLDKCNGSEALRIAIDTPSGINSSDGRVEGIAFNAHHTYTMAFIKTGMLSYPARQYCGEIHTQSIGYPKELCQEIPKDALIVDDDFLKDNIPKRKADSHKGSYGRLLMFCGSPYMTGAAILAAKAALRSGVGLVNIARDKDTLTVLQNHLIEPVFSCLSDNLQPCITEISELCKKATAIVAGCGMGTDERDKQILFSIIKSAQCPTIIDADGINCLCGNTHILKEAHSPCIITPHPLEFARLYGKSTQEIQQNRIGFAKQFAKDFGCIVVLKGASTVIADQSGHLCINTSGNAGLSKGGSGDVLAGLISSLAAQGINPFYASALAVYLHGKAGDSLKKKISEYGYLPSDLPLEIAKLLP